MALGRCVPMIDQRLQVQQDCVSFLLTLETGRQRCPPILLLGKTSEKCGSIGQLAASVSVVAFCAAAHEDRFTLFATGNGACGILGERGRC